MKEKEVLNQIEIAYESVYSLKKKELEKYQKTVSNIIFSSVGKSGLIQRVIHDLGTKVPVETSQEEKVFDMNNRSLVLIVSYSGKTKEILKLYKNSAKKTKKIIVITSEKNLLDDANKNGFLTIDISSDYDSASANFLTLYAVIFLLNRLNLISIDKKEIEESIYSVGDFSKNFKTFKYADELADKIPLIYTWNEFSCLGLMICNYFNIHAKHFAIRSAIPEADYNEIEALAFGDSKIIPIFLMPNGDKYEKARLLMNTYRLMSQNMTCLPFDMSGKSKLTQIITTAMFFELVSERLGKIKKVNPSSRDAIGELRDKIKHF